MEVSIDKSQEIGIKIEPTETSSNLKRNNEDTLGDLDIGKSHQKQIVESSSSIWDIQTEAQALGQQRAALILPPHLLLSSPMMTHSRAWLLAQQQ